MKIDRVIKNKGEKHRLEREARTAALATLPTVEEDAEDDGGIADFADGSVNLGSPLSMNSSFVSHASTDFT